MQRLIRIFIAFICSGLAFSASGAETESQVKVLKSAQITLCASDSQGLFGLLQGRAWKTETGLAKKYHTPHGEFEITCEQLAADQTFHCTAQLGTLQRSGDTVIAYELSDRVFATFGTTDEATTQVLYDEFPEVSTGSQFMVKTTDKTVEKTFRTLDEKLLLQCTRFKEPNGGEQEELYSCKVEIRLPK